MLTMKSVCLKTNYDLLTLIFATLYGIQANYYLIDAVIALTVCYKAFENLNGFKRYFNSESPNLTWMVFSFGLIHGFGLSTRLQQLPLGDEGIVLKIIAFNVGVEVGQVAALALMLLLLSGWRKTASFQRFSNAANTLMMVVGGLLLLMQLHGYQHSAYSHEFPINKDEHSHIHENIADKARTAKQSSLKENESLDLTIKEEKPSAHSHGNGSYHSH